MSHVSISISYIFIWLEGPNLGSSEYVMTLNPTMLQGHLSGSNNGRLPLGKRPRNHRQRQPVFRQTNSYTPWLSLLHLPFIIQSRGMGTQSGGYVRCGFFDHVQDAAARLYTYLSNETQDRYALHVKKLQKNLSGCPIFAVGERWMWSTAIQKTMMEPFVRVRSRLEQWCTLVWHGAAISCSVSFCKEQAIPRLRGKTLTWDLLKK